MRNPRTSSFLNGSTKYEKPNARKSTDTSSTLRDSNGRTPFEGDDAARVATGILLSLLLLLPLFLRSSSIQRCVDIRF